MRNEEWRYPKGPVSRRPKGVAARRPKGVAVRRPKGLASRRPKGLASRRPKGLAARRKSFGFVLIQGTVGGFNASRFPFNSGNPQGFHQPFLIPHS